MIEQKDVLELMNAAGRLSSCSVCRLGHVSRTSQRAVCSGRQLGEPRSGKAGDIDGMQAAFRGRGFLTGPGRLCADLWNELVD